MSAQLKTWIRVNTPAFLLDAYGALLNLATALFASRKREKIFCLNSGNCGSAYLIELLKANGLEQVFHEKKPDLDDAGVEYYLSETEGGKLGFSLWLTRSRIYCESSNRLFSLARIIHKVYPGAKFIHLYRDPREVLYSTMNKTVWLDLLNSDGLRYKSELCGRQDLPPFERTCHYWQNVNSRIEQDLQGLPYIRLKFEDLVVGKIEEVEKFIGKPLSVKTTKPANTKDHIKQKTEQYGPYATWAKTRKNKFDSICGALRKELGYAE